MKKLSLRNTIAFIITLVSLVLLYPGLLNDLLTIDISINLPILGKQNLHSETRSIIGTVQMLHENNNSFVAFLILFFSVIIPVLKGVILLMVQLADKLPYRYQLHKFVSIIGKWSMADVFVVGVFIAYLASQSNEQVNAELHSGFYFFLAYCLVSLIGIQLMQIEEAVKPDMETE